ncbi:MAG: hypothetical protein JNM18_02930 [Planctomycetaceae bacterium]|nr:hypothetical protein [Planctomycetaceae bacterium]
MIELFFELVVALLDMGFRNGHWRISLAALFGILFGLLAAIHCGGSAGLATLVALVGLGIVWDRYDDRSKD